MRLDVTTAYRMTAVALLAAIGGCDPGADRARGPDAPPSPSTEAGRQVDRAGGMLDDATLTAKVKTALILEPGLKGLAIDVDTAAKVVTLNGSADSERARRQAEQVARAVEGVKDVKNNLNVRPAS